MMDIVEWLRTFRISSSDSNFNAVVVNKRINEAADEIERLRNVVIKQDQTMNREEFYQLINPVRMLICNKMYDHAYKKILELANINIHITVNDDGYNEWLKEKE